MNVLIQAAAVIGAIGTIGGGVLVAESRYTAQDAFYRHVADSRSGLILDLVERARGAEGAYHDTLCRNLVLELNAICEADDGHPMCQDRSQYLTQAGC